MSASGASIGRGQNSAVVGTARPHEKKRKRFPHGNYTGYYNTRYGCEPASATDNFLRAGDRDPRLNILKRSWFEGKKCLDVGCNEGHLTLAIVRQFRPRRMVGVDIDGYLVQLAREALAGEINSATKNAKRRADREDFDSGGYNNALNNGVAFATGHPDLLDSRPLVPRSLRGGATALSTASAEEIKESAAYVPEKVRRGESNRVENGKRREGEHIADCGNASSAAGAEAVRSTRKKDNKIEAKPQKNNEASVSVVSDGAKDADLHGKTFTTATLDDAEEDTFLAGCAVGFRHEDFVLEAHCGCGYDAVCLFSVVKWMHLNGGDKAVQGVFRKTHELLRPGGRLILEPQPWKSYRKSARQHGMADARANADKIRMRPSDFAAFLTGEVGFRSWEELGMPGEGVGSFAKRSIHVFIK